MRVLVLVGVPVAVGVDVTVTVKVGSGVKFTVQLLVPVPAFTIVRAARILTVMP